MQMKRGNSRGRIINAKPIFLLSLFDLIEKKEIIDNKVFYTEQVEGCYKHCYNTYEPAMEVTLPAGGGIRGPRDPLGRRSA